MKRRTWFRCRPPRRPLSGCSGLTTVEAVGMTVILGLMAGLSCPAINGLRHSGMDQQAIGVAQALLGRRGRKGGLEQGAPRAMGHGRSEFKRHVCNFKK